MAQKACKGKTGCLGEQKKGTGGGKTRLGQPEEAEEIEYTYRPVLATHKKIICDPDSKTQRCCAGNPHIGPSIYKGDI